MLKLPKKPVQVGESYIRKPKETSNYRKRYSLFVCECGNEFESQVNHVKNGNTKSCGCYKERVNGDQSRTHGMRNHPIYRVWSDMIRRTTVETVWNYKNYGGRGIAVCDRWKDAKNFIDDMLPTYKTGLSIDRINNDNGYSKDNCRWTTRYVQARNRRVIASNNTSGYRGVSFESSSGKYIARIGVDNKHIHIGRFKFAKDAAVAWNKYVTDNNLEHTLNTI